MGWTAARPLEGTPSYLEQEIAAMKPAFAVVMMGTNDTEPTGVHRFEGNLRKLIDAILAAQVVPIVSTIPPRGDPTFDAVVPEMNAVIRALAQSRQVPYIDVWQTLAPLPQKGSISDGVHLNVFVMGGAHGCWFTSDALMYGHNQRNRLQLGSLDRARSFLVDGAAPKPTPPRSPRAAGASRGWSMRCRSSTIATRSRAPPPPLPCYAAARRTRAAPRSSTR